MGVWVGGWVNGLTCLRKSTNPGASMALLYLAQSIGATCFFGRRGWVDGWVDGLNEREDDRGRQRESLDSHRLSPHHPPTHLRTSLLQVWKSFSIPSHWFFRALKSALASTSLSTLRPRASLCGWVGGWVGGSFFWLDEGAGMHE